MGTKEIIVEVEVDEQDERIVQNNAHQFVRNSLRTASMNHIEEYEIIDFEVKG